MPWPGRRTERLIKRANDAVRLAYSGAGEVRAVYSTNRAFRLPKESLPTHKQSNLIYTREAAAIVFEIFRSITLQENTWTTRNKDSTQIYTDDEH